MRKAMSAGAGASGLVIGIVLSLALARLLASMLYGVSPGDISSLIAAGGLMVAVTAWRPG